jgi:hypothetical protein
MDPAALVAHVVGAMAHDDLHGGPAAEGHFRQLGRWRFGGRKA